MGAPHGGRFWEGKNRPDEDTSSAYSKINQKSERAKTDEKDFFHPFRGKNLKKARKA
jgi:hypothetical protein